MLWEIVKSQLFYFQKRWKFLGHDSLHAQISPKHQVKVLLNSRVCWNLLQSPWKICSIWRHIHKVFKKLISYHKLCSCAASIGKCVYRTGAWYCLKKGNVCSQRIVCLLKVHFSLLRLIFCKVPLLKQENRWLTFWA